MDAEGRKSIWTIAVHAGEGGEIGDFHPVVGAIHPSVGFTHDTMDDTDAVFEGTKPGYVYTRYGSPTVSAFESAVAALEGAEAAQAFSSGMAALHVSLLSAGVKNGSVLVAAYDLYGATYRLVDTFLAGMGVQPCIVDAADLEAVESALKRHRPEAVLAETISNPLLKIADVPALAGMAHRYGAQLLIDNTFASPYLFKPLEAGADYAIHSATKYLGGHGDVMAGVSASTLENVRGMAEINKLVGSVLGPQEAWLAHRGLKTLPLRVERQCANALKIAKYLQAHPKVSQVIYPGLPEHPQHALAERLFGGAGYGGVLSFEIGGADKRVIFRFIDSLRLILPATTLGDVYTLVLHPATASHRSLSPDERKAIGISDGLVRLSAGIEAPDDILEDLDNALQSLP